MATRILGLDIKEESLCAVVVEQQGTERTVLACGTQEMEGYDQIPAALSALLIQVGYTSGTCIVGLPLSIISLRNLTLPFTDLKKITQVLPLELEEQLLVPMDDQVLDFMVTGRIEAGSRLLVALLEKTNLHTLLPVFEENGLRVPTVVPSLFSQAREYMQGKGNTEPILFLQVDLYGMSVALWSGGSVLFMRNIAYPEMVLAEPFSPHQENLALLDQETVEQNIIRVCEIIQSSLYYFGQESEGGIRAQKVILSGCLSGDDWWHAIISRELKIDVERAALLESIPGMRVSPGSKEQCSSCLFDSALALAVSGLKKKKKTANLNFLQGEFASGSQLLLSRRSLLAVAVALVLLCTGAIGYLWMDYSQLNTRSTGLQKEMRSIFTETFPEVTRIVDPLVQMQSKLREVQSSEVSLPLFSGEKRVLEILSDISARIPQEISLHVSRLVIDQEAVQIKGTTDAYNNVDVIKNKLAASSRYALVKIVSATADKKNKKIRFEIRLQLAEAS